MLEDRAIAELRTALAALDVNDACCPFAAIEPLRGLAEAGLDVTIDYRASNSLGAPVIVARRRQSEPALLDPLTPRQRAVARLVVAGLPNKQIARELDISVATVKDHVHAILGRLGVKTRAALIAAALGAKT